MGTKEKEIKTDQLIIKGNILIWENTSIQLSNVSCISTNNFNSLPFPIIAIIVAIVGVVLFAVNVLLAIVVVLVAVGWIYYWYNKNQRLKSLRSLNIMMNSGNSFSIIFNNVEFLNKVVSVLNDVIISGGIGKGIQDKYKRL